MKRSYNEEHVQAAPDSEKLHTLACERLAEDLPPAASPKFSKFPGTDMEANRHEAAIMRKLYGYEP